ncbi:transposase [Novosphingopyxis sp. YJ-S2-01]|uniref:transposase n=1 Tax=Novosphingopyxis sp. YJ-S2-01 TaxID=2794021 RepID=UPI0018DDF823|nr:transposase [Novosphingopyxis sp. YJ-S2-01]MBH9538452.1 transposase [Novosphingopyxis sp. YJ-S2-01]
MLHPLAEAFGRPLAFHLTGGETADCKPSDALIVVPERTPDAPLPAGSYSADGICADLAKRSNAPVVPGRLNRRVEIGHHRMLYKKRNRIELTFGHIKVNRAIANRYHPLANSHFGMVRLVTAREWLRFV